MVRTVAWRRIYADLAREAILPRSVHVLTLGCRAALFLSYMAKPPRFSSVSVFLSVNHVNAQWAEPSISNSQFCNALISILNNFFFLPAEGKVWVDQLWSVLPKEPASCRKSLLCIGGPQKGPESNGASLLVFQHHMRDGSQWEVSASHTCTSSCTFWSGVCERVRWAAVFLSPLGF